MSIDNNLMSTDNNTMSIDNRVMSTDNEIMSIDNKAMSTDNIAMSTDSKIMSIDNKSRICYNKRNRGKNMRSDWMPSRRIDRLNMAMVWREILLRKGDEWGVTAEEMVEMNALIKGVEDAAADAMHSGGGSVDRTRVRGAYAALTAFMRALKSRRFLCPPLTGGDLVSLLLKPRDATLTGHYEVRETVDFVLELRAIREILVKFWISGAAGKARPANCNGAVIAWAVLDAPPESIGELTNQALATRTPHALSFAYSERGKMVYVAAAWQNKRGKLGPWSGILNTVVP